MTGTEWAAALNRAALAHDDHSEPRIEYPGLQICAAVLLRPEPVLTLTVRTLDAAHDRSQAAPKLLPAYTPVELFRDDDLVHRDAPPSRAHGLDAPGLQAKPRPRWGGPPREVVRARAARLARMIRARAKPRDEEWEELLVWVHRINHAALAYNFDDAGPTIEYPGVRIFVYLQPDGTLAINVWTKDTDEDSSLATADDLPAHITVELFRDDRLVRRDAPTPPGGAA